MEAPRTHDPANQPSPFEHVISLCVTLVMLEQHSRLPEASFGAAVLCGLAMLGLGLTHVARLIKYRVTCRSILSWLAFPLAVTLMLSSAVTHWPATVRFYLSKPSFDELISQAFSGQEPKGFPRRVGLYWIDRVNDADFNYADRQGRIGFVTGVALVDECGLCYDESDPKPSHWLTIRIAPRWYLKEW